MTTGAQAVRDPLGAFCQDSGAALRGGPGPLANLTFAAKDLYDIAGFVTGGGNLATRFRTVAEAAVKVTYHYTPDPCLKAGTYTIRQTAQPPGLLDNFETAGNVTPIPGSANGPDQITVTLAPWT